MTLHFCTYFDHRYLPRGLALYRSLARHCPGFTLDVLCLSEECHDALTRAGLPGLRPIRLAALEAFDPGLLRVKPERSAVEYYFTSTPALLRYLFDLRPEIELLTYLDADLYFFADPQPLVDELASGSIGIIEHRFPPDLREREAYGIYNVGWVSFRRTPDGVACLEWWRERCLEWCFDHLEAGRFADQKYLDEWPRRFPGVVVLRHSGANLAPWNLRSHALTARGDGVHVDGAPLLFFHAHGVELTADGGFEAHLEDYGAGAALDALVRERIYVPYVRELESAGAAAAALLATGPAPAASATRADPPAAALRKPRSGPAARPGSAPEEATLRTVILPRPRAAALPRISLVTPSYNQAVYLEATLDSVLAQGYPNLEYIVIDGGSTDGSVEILRRHQDRLAYWESAPDRGQGHAINKGFARASGEIMGWINADDLLLPGALSLVGRLFQLAPDMEWLTCAGAALDPEGSIIETFERTLWTRDRFLDSDDQFIQQESTFWRRRLWERAGGEVREDLLACDFELWARFFRHARLFQTRGGIGAFRYRPSQRSATLRERYLVEAHSVILRERSGEVATELSEEESNLLSEIRFNPQVWSFERLDYPDSKAASDRSVHSFFRIAPPLRSGLLVMNIRTPPWRVELTDWIEGLFPEHPRRGESGVSFYWLGHGERGGLGFSLVSDRERAVRFAVLVAPGPSRADRRRTVRLLAGALDDSAEVRREVIEGPAEVAWELALRPGENRFTLAILESPEANAAPGGETRPLLVAISELRID